MQCAVPEMVFAFYARSGAVRRRREMLSAAAEDLRFSCSWVNAINQQQQVREVEKVSRLRERMARDAST